MRTPHQWISSSWHPSFGFLGLTWRAVEVVLGMALLALGAVLMFTGFFAFIGLPMAALGLFLTVRGFTKGIPTA